MCLRAGEGYTAFPLPTNRGELHLNPLVRRSWALKGKTPVIGGDGGHRKKVSVIGAVSVSPTARHLGLYFSTLPDGYFTAGEVVEFLRDLLKHLRGKAGVPRYEPVTAAGFGYTVGVTGDASMPPLPLPVVFDDLPDPRRDTRNKLHPLTDVPTIATCAVIAGADTWEDIAEYGRTKEAFLRRSLVLPHGVPGPDTFARVFAKLDPAAFARAFGRRMAAACEATGLVPVAIDGKSARSAERDTATGCLHPATAWATENRLVPGRVAVPDGSNEVAAVPELLRTPDLTGAIVTIDAAGCRVEDARIIRDRGGRYLSA